MSDRPDRPATRPAPEAGTVLVVDDDPMVRELLRAGLSARGVAVVTASTGAEAVEVITAAPPDLVVSDVEMPELDGLGLVDRLRSDPSLRHVPLLLLTSRATADDAALGLRLGADDYIRKPFDVVEVVARVEARLRRRPVPSAGLARDLRSGALRRDGFVEEVAREAARGGRRRAGAVVAVGRAGGAALWGAARDDLVAALHEAVRARLGPEDVVGADDDGRLLVLLPGVTRDGAAEAATGLLEAAAARLPAGELAAAWGPLGEEAQELVDGVLAEQATAPAGAVLRRREPRRGWFRR